MPAAAAAAASEEDQEEEDQDAASEEDQEEEDQEEQDQEECEYCFEGASAERVRDLTGGLGADVVLDVIGSDQVVLESLRSLTIGGRLLSLGYVAGEIPSVRLNRLLLANIDVSGVAWGPWTRAHPGFARQQWDELMPLVESGAVRPDVRQIVPVEDIAAAMRAMLDRKSLGKTVLRFV